MSYARMDHAEWVESAILACKRRLTARDRKKAAGWAHAPDKLTPFQARAFDILGIIYGGIYNAPISWGAVSWTGVGVNGIRVPVNHSSLATFDFQELTTLVFLCHEARIRCQISAHGVGGMAFQMNARGRDGGMARSHPNLDEAVAAFRAYIPADHRIFYRDPAVEPTATPLADAAPEAANG